MAFNIDYSVCVVVMAVLTGVYVIAGGYMATAINDFIQGVIMIFGICAVIVAVLKSQGGFLAALNGLAGGPGSPGVRRPRHLQLLLRAGPGEPAGRGDPHLSGHLGLPQIGAEVLRHQERGRSEQGHRHLHGFAFIVAGGCYFLGGCGRLFSNVIEVGPNGVPVGGYDAVIPTMLSGLPDMLIAVVVILVLSASMSTLSSLVLASSSTLTLDFLKDNIIKNMDEKRQVAVMRALIVVFIAISVVLAIIQYKSSVTFIAQLMGVSWGALAGAFLAPFLYGLYWKRASRAACWVSFAFSTVVMIANIFVRASFPRLLQSPINAAPSA
jgi:SSS family solute:Na+ symporter